MPTQLLFCGPEPAAHLSDSAFFWGFIRPGGWDDTASVVRPRNARAAALGKTIFPFPASSHVRFLYRQSDVPAYRRRICHHDSCRISGGDISGKKEVNASPLARNDRLSTPYQRTSAFLLHFNPSLHINFTISRCTIKELSPGCRSSPLVFRPCEKIRLSACRFRLPARSRACTPRLWQRTNQLEC